MSVTPIAPQTAPPAAEAGTGELERAVLAKAVSRMFNEWNLPAADRAVMLGLGENNRTSLGRYALGRPFANSRDLLDRAGHLLAIYKSLALLYPENPDIRAGWVSAPNRRFNGLSPVEVVRRYGFTGLMMVRARLDRMRGH